MLGLGEKAQDFVPAEAFGGIANGGRVFVPLLLGGLESREDGA